jgi:hypothetical protein
MPFEIQMFVERTIDALPGVQNQRISTASDRGFFEQVKSPRSLGGPQGIVRQHTETAHAVGSIQGYEAGQESTVY